MDERSTVLGLDIGGTRIKWVHWSPASGVLDRGWRPTPRSDASAVVSAAAELISDRRMNGAGVGVPGHLSDDHRGIRLIPNLPGKWSGLRFADELEARTAVPVRLTNDARAFARAELELGAARGRDDALFVTLGTGIGGALALGGRVVRSRGDALGELGHIICRPDGEPCGCGASGCLETIAGGSALVARARAGGGSAETPEDVVRAATLSDGPERAVLADAGHALGFVLSNVIAFSSVTVVVVGGGVAPAFAFMKRAVEAELTARARLVGAVDIRLAHLGGGAGALGAALEIAESLTAAPTGGPREPATAPHECTPDHPIEGDTP